jgi:hypothetical protein
MDCINAVMDTLAERIEKCGQFHSVSAAQASASFSSTAIPSTTTPGTVSAALKQIWSTYKVQLPTGPAEQAAYSSQRQKEPLHHLIGNQHKIWQDTMEPAAVYPPKEAAKHAQRLKAYVRAAAARAAGQLEPGLTNKLYGVLRIEP